MKIKTATRAELEMMYTPDTCCFNGMLDYFAKGEWQGKWSTYGETFVDNPDEISELLAKSELRVKPRWQIWPIIKIGSVLEVILPRSPTDTLVTRIVSQANPYRPDGRENVLKSMYVGQPPLKKILPSEIDVTCSTHNLEVTVRLRYRIAR